MKWNGFSAIAQRLKSPDGKRSTAADGWRRNGFKAQVDTAATIAVLRVVCYGFYNFRLTESRAAAAQKKVEMFSETRAHAVKGDRVDARIDVRQTETYDLIGKERKIW